jgi:large subunit ribosomal protein L25
MKKHTLNGEIRKIFGRKNKQLRQKNMVPATVYGKKTTSMSISVGSDDFTKVFAEVGESGLVELSVGNEKLPVLVNNVQVHPVTRNILHVEFHKVDLKEKVHAKVPLEFVGEAQAVAQKLGALLTLVDEIEVEALPTDLPEKITVDVTKLANINDEIKISELKISTGVTVISEPTQSVVRVTELVSKQAEAQEAAQAAESAAAKEASAEAAVPPTEAAAATPAPEAKPKTEK